MGRIKILEERLIDKIAAGEVVERPASVVKELIENSIDARASSIEVDISEGGKKSIKVSDDGEGMDRDDLILAFDRYATSKIFKEKDLFSIKTMGFRGEALPSIASVSSMQIRSGTRLETPGNEIIIQGGIISKVNEVAPLKGTLAAVQSLFFNTPARRKFTRTEKTELSHIVTWVQNSALSFYEKRFRLSADDKLIFNFSPVRKRLERISQIFGVRLARQLIPFEKESEHFSIEAYISKPGEIRKDRSGQRFFVNGRLIKDRLLSIFTWSAYKEFFPSAHPLLFLFIDIDPSLIDVNVHPAKMEVRFFQPQAVQDSIQQSLRTVYKKAVNIPPISTMPPSDEQKSLMTDQFSAEGEYQQQDQLLPPSTPLSLSESSTARFQLIGQHKDTFIIASEEGDLIIVDQHIAHERVLFDELRRQIQEGVIQKQKLIFPITMECSAAELAWLDTHIETLQKIGIQLVPFGKLTFKVEEVPSILPIDAVAQTILEMASEHSSSSEAEQEEFSKCIASLACHSAVKSGAKLEHSKMEYILKSLFQSSNPYYCPHGRPIMMKIESSELKKKFQRDF
jgi:DNA mismatch repair protein MutL